MVIETGRPIPEIAEKFGVHSGTLHSWVSRWRRNGSASCDRPAPAASGGRLPPTVRYRARGGVGDPSGVPFGVDRECTFAPNALCFAQCQVSTSRPSVCRWTPVTRPDSISVPSRTTCVLPSRRQRSSTSCRPGACSARTSMPSWR
ncbi:transposase [Streptomyces sp. NBC_01614]|uniref:transposase n=1 Tax=Streptomyces sp. NBC_01614 TaxID=2975897 RepID=UPI003870DC96